MSERDDAPRPPEPLVWDIEFRLVTDPFIWWDLARVTGISVGIMWVLVLLMSLAIGEDPVLIPPWVLLLTGGIMMVLMALSTLLLWKYGFTATLDARGVRWEASRRTRRINRVLAVALALSGRPGPAGAGLLAVAGESGSIPWREVRQAREYASRRVIAIRNSWRTVNRLYCAPEVWDDAVAWCRWGVAHGGELRASDPPRPRRPVLPAIAWALGAVVLAGLVPAWSWVDQDWAGRATVMCGLAVALAGVLEGPLRRLFALGGLSSAAAVSAAVVLSALEPLPGLTPYDKILGFSTVSWQLDTPLLALSAAALLGLLGMSAWRLFGPAWDRRAETSAHQPA